MLNVECSVLNEFIQHSTFSIQHCLRYALAGSKNVHCADSQSKLAASRHIANWGGCYEPPLRIDRCPVPVCRRRAAGRPGPS